MPVYTYKCKDCGLVFDFLMIKKTEKPKCKGCGSYNLEKQLTTFAVRMDNTNTTGGSNSSCPTGTCPISG